MSNTLLTIGMITRESLRVLENQLPFTKNVNTQYEDQFAQTGKKAGDTINVRKPPRYLGRRGPNLSVENSTETSVPLTVSQYGCDISFSSKDLTLSIDDFSKRFIVPAVATVANMIELDGLAMYKNVHNVVGSVGTALNRKAVSQANALLDANAAPFDGLRSLVLDPYHTADLQDNVMGLFQQSTDIAEGYKKGRFGEGLGFKGYTAQNCWTHQVGVYGGTPLTNGAGQTGSTLVTDGWTATTTTLNVGDTFTIEDVYAVNPQSRQSTGKLQNFVVTEKTVTDGSGNSTIKISPAIIPSGAFQTVSNAAGDGKAITVTSGASGASVKQSMGFHRDAFTFATVDMELPKGVHMAERITSRASGISLRAIQAYDINTDQMPLRLDVLGGWATTYAELATRIQGGLA